MIWPALLAIEPGLARQVLVIEDNLHDALLLQTALEEVAPEIQVIRVLDGPAALRVLESGPVPWLVVLDLHLPGEESVNILQALRSWGGDALRVVCWSSHAHPSEVAVMCIHGADQYVEKPVGLSGFFALAEHLSAL